MQGAKIVAEYKVILVGDGGVGKTTFIKRLIPHSTKPYQYSGCQTTQYFFYTNIGLIKILIRDTNGCQKLGGLRKQFFINSHAAFIMFDVTTRISYKNVPMWYKQIKQPNQNIPIVLLGNKIDLMAERKVKPKMILFPLKKKIQYFDISAKANYNYDKPFLSILKSLTKNPNIQILQPLNLKLPQIQLDPIKISQLIMQWQKIKQAQKQIVEAMDQQDY